jgi:hypothetical protein
LVESAGPSASCSTASTVFRSDSYLSGFQIDSQTLRLQAQANNRSLRSLVLPRRNSSIFCGSVQARHSRSVMPSRLSQPGSAQAGSALALACSRQSRLAQE